MVQAIEALERQLRTIRALKTGIAIVNATPGGMRRVQPQVLHEAYQWANDASLLNAARPMFWTRETASAVVAMAPTVDLHSIVCERELLYCDLAFCWFEDPPMSVTLKGGGPVPVQALTWAFAVNAVDRTPVMTITAYTLRNAALSPMTWTSVVNGLPLDQFERPRNGAFGDEQLRVWSDQCTKLFQFVVCAGAFLRQKIAGVSEARADRYARKRIAAAGWAHEPVVSVVQLREREKRSDAIEGGGSREYQWQWMVRAHTRQRGIRR